MSLAYIYTQSKERDCISIQYLQNFDLDQYICDDETERIKTVYAVKKPGCPRERCIVLAIAENEVEMDKIAAKRLKIPKLNASAWVEPLQQIDTTNAAFLRRQRKETEIRKAKNKKDTNSEILAAYLNKSTDGSQRKGLKRSNQIANVMGKKAIKESSAGLVDDSNEQEKSEDDNNISITEMRSAEPVHASSPKIRRLAPVDSDSEREWSDSDDLIVLKAKLAIAVRKYENLKKIKPLTEATGQKLLAILTEKGPENVWPSAKFGTIKDGKICISNDVWIKTAAYNDAMQAKKPRGFVLTLCYSMWSIEQLAQRVVRKSINCSRGHVITPEKREAVSFAFSKWLKHSGYCGTAKVNEMAMVNSYIGRAIDRCKKALNFDANSSTNKSISTVSKSASSKLLTSEDELFHKPEIQEESLSAQSSEKDDDDKIILSS